MLYINQSEIHGYGLYSDTTIKANDFIFVAFHAKAQSLDKEIEYAETGFAMFVNHSNVSNTFFKLNQNNILLYASVDINPMEEITSNYFDLLKIHPSPNTIQDILEFLNNT